MRFVFFTILLFIIYFAAACEKDTVIEIELVFPAGQPDIIDKETVSSFYVNLTPQGISPHIKEQSLVLKKGEDLSVTGLDEGYWTLNMSGLDKDNKEVVLAKSLPFLIERGKNKDVRVFLGKTDAFNSVRMLNGGEFLANLAYSSVTAFKDENTKDWILVAGGKKNNSEKKTNDAFLIDPAGFTVKKIDSLTCARSGHSALSVITETGTKIVISGGDTDDCPNQLDIFDTSLLSFSSIDVSSCDIESDTFYVELDGLFGTGRHSGRIVFPSDRPCIVDILTKKIEKLPDEFKSPAPSNPSFAVSNSSGQVLILSSPYLFIDGAYADSFCETNGNWIKEARWLDEDTFSSKDLSVHRLSSDKFLLLWTASGENMMNWSIVTLRDCKISGIVQGKREILNGKGYTVLDLDSSSEAILITGGTKDNGSFQNQVTLLSYNSDAIAPTWHDMSLNSRSNVMKLAEARAGHKVVKLLNDQYWVVGGGPANPEIFIRGTSEFSVKLRNLKVRTPFLQTMTVLDSTSKADSLNNAFTNQFPEVLYNNTSKYFPVHSFYAGNCDPGIGDGFSPADLYGDPTVCEKGGEPVIGKVTKSEGTIVMTTPYGDTVSFQDPKTAFKNLLKELLSGQPGCHWRQFFKVAFDEITPDSHGESTPLVPSAGVFLFLLVVSDDDCSQNLYDDTEVSKPPFPSDDDLKNHECTWDGFDEYFQLPPSEDYKNAFVSLVDKIAWDRKDVVIAAIGAENESCDHDDFGNIVKPERILGAFDVLNEKGIETVFLDVCEMTGSSLNLDEIMISIVDRISWQACVPDLPFVQNAELDPETGWFIPADGKRKDILDASSSIAFNISEKCKLVFLQRDVFSELELFQSREIAASDFLVTTDVNTNAPEPVSYCPDTGWLIRTRGIELENGKEVVGGTLVCVE